MRKGRKEGKKKGKEIRSVGRIEGNKDRQEKKLRSSACVCSEGECL